MADVAISSVYVTGIVIKMRLLRPTKRAEIT
jgi:hypothetical protein